MNKREAKRLEKEIEEMDPSEKLNIYRSLLTSIKTIKKNVDIVNKRVHFLYKLEKKKLKSSKPMNEVR